jgi:hypothetical protein
MKQHLLQRERMTKNEKDVLLKLRSLRTDPNPPEEWIRSISQKAVASASGRPFRPFFVTAVGDTRSEFNRHGALKRGSLSARPHSRFVYRTRDRFDYQATKFDEGIKKMAE